MRKAIFLSILFAALVIGMTSCKKCYICKQSTTEILFNQDTTLNLSTEVCSGKNGAGANVKVAVQDIEATGYICTPK